jgi:hypothetical protein
VIGFNEEPVIKVGLMSGAREGRITLGGPFTIDGGQPVAEGDYEVRMVDGEIDLIGNGRFRSPSIRLNNDSRCHDRNRFPLAAPGVAAS